MTSKQDKQRSLPIVLDTSTLHLGDCINVMSQLPAESVDSIAADPPYGIRFMGKAWDGADIDNMIKTKMRKGTLRGDGFERNDGAAFAAGTYDTSLNSMRAFQEWTRLWGLEAMRVLKPGGHLVSFAAPRTYHRMASGIEDAGFEIRDQLMWIFGSGFPKSHNLDGDHEGWGTALKPAHEPILLARKPLAGSVADNMARYGVGALNIEACRIPASGKRAQGRWPANVLHDGSDEVLQAFPNAPGALAEVTGNEPTANGFSGTVKYTGMLKRQAAAPIIGDSGNAARFFYCAKASTLDRDEGVTAPPKPVVQFQTANGTSGKASSLSAGRKTQRRNDHPTVKPTDLMRYLLRLITPPYGIVLDPFMGSGSTGKAAMLEGMQFIGIDLDAHYRNIAADRIRHAYILKRKIDANEAFADSQLDLL